MLVEPVAGSPWNGWPDVHGIRGRINVVRAVSRKIGEIHKVETIKTPWDKFVEGLEVMTDRRCRHLPVREKGRLAGMVSIGDLVNHRLRELEYEALKMKQMIVG